MMAAFFMRMTRIVVLLHLEVAPRGLTQKKREEQRHLLIRELLIPLMISVVSVLLTWLLSHS